MNPFLTFASGILILCLFGWYVATETSRLKRILGTVLSLFLVAVCFEAIYPPKDKIRLGLDLQGGTSFLIRLVKAEGEKIDPHVRDQAVEVIRKRIDQFGVSEPVITPEGEDRILVQIPGLDAEKIEDARQQLKKVAKLEMRLVHPQSDQLIPAIEAGQEPTPPGYRIETEKETRNGKTYEGKLLVKIKPDIEGTSVKSGYPTYDQKGWGVGIQFTPQGSDLFGKLTAAHVGERFAIVLDGEIQSAPTIQAAIYGGNASITGRFSEKEARNLASVLENPLAVPVEIAEERSASSTLGTDSIKSGILAGLGGLVLVLIFVSVYYQLAGLFAIVALLFNIIILLGAMAMFNFVLTLPGIAGVILTIGLAVDANVLIYERLREELATGKSLSASIEGAYSKAFTVIFDANATTLITAAILFWKATGPVKGFAVTLTVGVIASVFTAMIVGRNCFDWSLRGGLSRIKMLNLVSEKLNIDFLGKAKIWIGISLAVIAISVTSFAIRGEKNFGIDFKGGDLLILESKSNLSEGDVRKVLKRDDLIIQKERERSSNVDYISVRSPQVRLKPLKRS